MSQEERKVKFEDFFDFDAKEPINRLAYTKEDMDYKIKIIKKMQELGMEITVDKACNICGTIKMGNNPKKTLAIGSHTDSVYDGGQYDGPVGVIVGLDIVEKMQKTKDMNGIINVVIYGCEESSRFGNACLGSKYLNGNIQTSQFDKIFDQKELGKGNEVKLKDEIKESIEYLKANIEGIIEVEKVFEEVDYSLEAHIEQYEILHKQRKQSRSDIIGIVNSVGSALRVKYDVSGLAGHTGSTPMRKRKNAVDATAFIGKKVRKLGKRYEEEGLGRASQVEINTIGHGGSFNQIPDKAQGLIDFRLLGENKPEKVLSEFSEIIKKVEEKTKTEIKVEVVSKGTPVITSRQLNSKIADACTKNEVKYLDMPSYAGQDTGYIPAKEKTMIFIPSKGGSHNPKESTKKEHIELASKVLTDVAKELLQERVKDKYAVDLEVAPVILSQASSVQEKASVKGIEK